MNIVQLTSSTFYGGPERQMLGLARVLPERYRTHFLSFAEGGRCRAFLEQAQHEGFAAQSLKYDSPNIRAAVAELSGLLRRWKTAVLCCHGYKADLLGRWAAWRAGIPAVAVSRGWTRESWKVRLYEALDRRVLPWMDQVVCVSQGQALKVRTTGIPAERVTVIRNVVDTARFARPNPDYRTRLQAFFPRPVDRIVCAAGRLSPEKGFHVLVTAAKQVVRKDSSVGFVLFGDGPLRAALTRQVAAEGLTDRFVLPGFRQDLDGFLPFVDLLVLPSFTEGLPNVVLEALAAGVAVVATAVGGTPEVVEDGVNGFLVPAGDADALARRVQDLLVGEIARKFMGAQGRWRIRNEFTFAAQAAQYQQLFDRLSIGSAENRKWKEEAKMAALDERPLEEAFSAAR